MLRGTICCLYLKINFCSINVSLKQPTPGVPPMQNNLSGSSQFAPNASHGGIPPPNQPGMHFHSPNGLPPGTRIPSQIQPGMTPSNQPRIPPVQTSSSQPYMPPMSQPSMSPVNQHGTLPDSQPGMTPTGQLGSTPSSDHGMPPQNRSDMPLNQAYSVSGQPPMPSHQPPPGGYQSAPPG